MKTFHLLGLPNAPVSPDYPLCGFAQQTLKMAELLQRMGQRVVLYGAENSFSGASDFVQCIDNTERVGLLGNTPYHYAGMNAESSLWMKFNNEAIQRMAERLRPRDIILTIGGHSQRCFQDAFPSNPVVEYSIGYPGSFAKYRVFESNAWRHWTYGKEQREDGHFFDAVIPCFFRENEYFYTLNPDDYVLYVGRLTPRKGIGIACDVCKAAGVPLKVIGHGDKRLVTYGEYLGPVSSRERNVYMTRAKAVICPTTYIEPFGCVAVEAQLCGTPVIATAFGGFTDTVKHGRTGILCNYFGEFVQAIKQVEAFDRQAIQNRARNLFGFAAAGYNYGRYFNQLELLYGKGWYDLGDSPQSRTVIPDLVSSSAYDNV